MLMSLSLSLRWRVRPKHQPCPLGCPSWVDFHVFMKHGRTQDMYLFVDRQVGCPTDAFPTSRSTYAASCLAIYTNYKLSFLRCELETKALPTLGHLYSLSIIALTHTWITYQHSYGVWPVCVSFCVLFNWKLVRKLLPHWEHL